jgi:hypothetical protein
VTPQSSFLIAAPVSPQRVGELRALLDSMNAAPGQIDPNNALVPFAQFDGVHFARLFIIEDATLEDIEAFGLAPRTYPLYLAFMGDVDGGDANAFLDAVATRCEPGLRAIFNCCEGFAGVTAVAAWMRAHEVRAAAAYGNWQGRSMLQIREEAALYDALERYLDENAAAFAGLAPLQLYERLRAFAEAEVDARRLTLTPEAPTPMGWKLRDLAHLIGFPLALLITSPLLLIIGVILLIRIRQLEQSDPEIKRRVTVEHADMLASIEDYDVTNQFSVVGSVKPGLVRRWSSTFILWITDYAARHLFTRGHLARIQTIHSASWTWLDGKERLLFCSNYDGSLDAYNDDFINKVSFGLNATFGGGVGYPRTNWLVLNGADDEQPFKYVLRRKQIPTQVWYNAHPGLTAYDLHRNARIREGLQTAPAGDDEARTWLALL